MPTVQCLLHSFRVNWNIVQRRKELVPSLHLLHPSSSHNLLLKFYRISILSWPLSNKERINWQFSSYLSYIIFLHCILPAIWRWGWHEENYFLNFFPQFYNSSPDSYQDYQPGVEHRLVRNIVYQAETYTAVRRTETVTSWTSWRRKVSWCSSSLLSSPGLRLALCKTTWKDQNVMLNLKPLVKVISRLST